MSESRIEPFSGIGPVQQAAFAAIENLAPLRAYLEGTDERTWILNRVRSEDGDCMLGHIHRWACEMTGDEDQASRICDAFEARWATTYMFYAVNDGTDPRYSQTTPKQRCLAYLDDLAAGRVESTSDIEARMLAEYEQEVHDA